jgi:hypothetical protein
MARKVVDDVDLGALNATLEEVPGPAAVIVRVRPHQPAAYFAAQLHSVILSVDAVKSIVEMLRRSGRWQD